MKHRYKELLNKIFIFKLVLIAANNCEKLTIVLYKLDYTT